MKDSNTERKGLAALACFKQALNLDSNNAKLWIECGSLAYWIHSMTSRLINLLINIFLTNPALLDNIGSYFVVMKHI